MIDYLKGFVKAKQDSRNWSDLPAGFEIEAVRHLAAQFKPHLKGLIGGRIAVAKADSFADLLAALDRAEIETGNRLRKAGDRLPEVRG